ncbi:MAG: amylo-alpha-1,6-glucosidase [Synergistaceae bacterium]|nr:amylo-alpha-1,6-glucosidase [Synergistaceae bacterium]
MKKFEKGMIGLYLGKADVNTYDKGAEREFLVSNGAGVYGSSTVIGANTRSEHGILVVRPRDSETHMVLVSKLEETLIAHNKKYQLSTNRYKDLIYPDGYRYLQEYQGSPYPDMLFVIHSIFLRKSVFMPLGGTCTVVRYELMESPDTVVMDVRPLFAHRKIDTACPDHAGTEFEAEANGGVVNVSGRGLISHVSFTGSKNSAKWSEKPMWLENLIYEKDAESDKPTIDSLWSPGYGTVSLNRGDVLYVVLSEEPLSYSVDELESLMKETVDRQDAFVRDLRIDTKYSLAENLAQAARHLVTENEGYAPAILSGFPSAEKRARDTFIALPGLTLATGRAVTAKGILENWLGYVAGCGGIMPSYINPNGEAVTGDIDSGLWFLYAVGKYSAAEGFDFARSHYGELASLLGKYEQGAPELGAVLDADTKLLKYFNLKETRNWMSGDADGEPLVDRRGYLVEVNALWYDALRFMEELAMESGDTGAAKKYAETASAARESFIKVFWNERAKYLYDWVDPSNSKSDDLIRPNAILAVSLPHSVLPDDMGKVVFTTCWDHLYTTYGLRTLDPGNEKFKGRAEGRPDQKKKARLRGMAWPWLLSHFITAYMRFHPDGQEMGWRFIRPFTSHLRRGCLGGVAEYFDGVMPYKPNGDVLSAISVGELLRVMRENLMNQ